MPAIVQEEGTGQVLMMAWMTPETLRLTLDEGRTVFWSRSRQEVWRKGETSGERQWVRAAYYDCDGDMLLFVVEQEGGGACHTGEHSLLLPPLRGLTAVVELRIRPTRGRVPRPGRRPHRRAGVAELLADLETPVAAYAKLVGDGTGFLLESVEHGERWSRFSFVGRDAGGHARAARRARSTVDGAVPAGVPLDRGMLAALEALLARYRAPGCPTCRRCRAGSSATSATTSSARSSACPTCRPTTGACPTP